MPRLSPITLLLPFFAGCCCCGMGSFGGGSHVPAEQLGAAKTLKVDGVGDVVATLGSEPYSINTDNALGSESSISGSDLTLSVGLGEASTSLPQLDAVTVGETTSLTLNGVDVGDLAIVKKGLGTVKASGKATNVTVDADGLCTVELYDLNAENVTVNITGDGASVDVTATGKLTVNISGNGYVSYKGGAEVVENITGSGSVTNMDDEGDISDPADGESVPTDGEDAAADAEAGDGDSASIDPPEVLDGEGFGEVTAPQPDVPNASGD